MQIYSLRLFVTTVTFITAAAASAIASPLPDRPHIYVEGYAELEVEPDQMTITVGLAATDDDLPSAKATVDANSRRLISAVNELGIDARDIATTTLQVRPAYEYEEDNPVLVGVIAYRQIDITLRNLEEYSPLIQALVDADISRTLRTRFSVSNETDILERTVDRALVNATTRARRMAESQGQRLGRIHSISEFDDRQNERYRLYPHRQISGQASRVSADSAALPISR